jgi:hypothetical protein
VVGCLDAKSRSKTLRKLRQKPARLLGFLDFLAQDEYHHVYLTADTGEPETAEVQQDSADEAERETNN